MIVILIQSMLMTYLVILVAPCVVLPHPENEVQDGNECTDGVGVTLEHDVTESNIVVGCDMTSGYSCEGGLQTLFERGLCDQ